jgi:hypothetical protein
MLTRLTSARILHTLLLAAAVVVSVTTGYAQPYAKVMVQSGNVSFIKDASGYTFALLDKTELKPGYKIKTGIDGYAKIRVPDGSTFEVFPNSEVVYTKTDSIQDLVNVWLGRIKVMIQHLPGVPNPNNVVTPTALISVRGTIFDVEVEDMEGTTVVSVDDGMVDVKHRLKAGPIVKLIPGMAIRVFPDQPLAATRDKGGFLLKAAKAIERAAYDAIYSRPGGVGGSSGGNLPTGNGKQGDNGNGKTTGTGTGTGAPTAPGTGAPPPPPPPPGGGGG